MSHHTLDARFLLCPLPVIRTQEKIRHLAPGDTLEVLCTDHGVLADIPAWCRIHGHQHLESFERDGVVVIRLRVQGDDADATASPAAADAQDGRRGR